MVIIYIYFFSILSSRIIKNECSISRSFYEVLQIQKKTLDGRAWLELGPQQFKR